MPATADVELTLSMREAATFGRWSRFRCACTTRLQPERDPDVVALRTITSTARIPNGALSDDDACKQRRSPKGDAHEVMITEGPVMDFNTHTKYS